MSKTASDIKRERFVSEFLKCGNASESYRKAGYNAKTDAAIHTNAARLLRDEHVRKMIDDGLAKISNDNIMGAKEALELLTSIARGETKETVLLTAGPNVYKEEKEADIKTRIAAVKELIKRYPNGKSDDKIRIRKLEAETRIVEAKANILENGGNDTENMLTALLDEVRGGSK